MSKTLLICTLVFLRQDDRLLLGWKKRGFGRDRWNGIGGKVDPGETIEQAMIRECQEEIGVTPTKYHKVAIHDFVIGGSDPHIQAHTYLCDGWEGTPTETAEMNPRWFNLADIPYDQMWSDDQFWLPQVLAGQLLHTKFTFDEHEQLIDRKVHQAHAQSLSPAETEVCLG